MAILHSRDEALLCADFLSQLFLCDSLATAFCLELLAYYKRIAAQFKLSTLIGTQLSKILCNQAINTGAAYCL